MFMKKFSYQTTVINYNEEEEDENDWNSVMAKCLGARHLAMLPQIPDITMSDAGEPSGIFSSMEDPEIGRDMGSICHTQNSPILPKTIIERVPNSPVSSPFPSPYPSPFPSPSPVSRSPSPGPSPQLSQRVSRASFSSSKSLRTSLRAPTTPSPMNSPQGQLQPSPRTSPQLSQRVSRASFSSSKSLRTSLRAPAKPSPMNSPQGQLQASPRTSPQPSPRASPQPSSRASPQPSPRASPQLSSRASPRLSSRASPQPSPRASPRLSSRASPQPSPRASPQPSPSFGPSNYADKRPKRFLKGKRCQKWRGQHPIYRPLENGCFEVTGLTHAKTPDIKKRKVTKVIKANKVRQETKKTNICNLSESFVGKSVSARSKNEELIKSFENLQWKKTKGSDSIELASLFRDKTNGLASGFFRMNGICEKPSQKTANYKTIYTLLKGSVAFKIGDDPFMVINEFESVTIPERTGYGMKNLSDDESILYFNVYQY